MIETLNIALRAALYVDLMLLFGLPLFGLYALTGAERGVGGPVIFRPLMIGLSTIAVGLSLLSFVVMTAAMAGVAISDVGVASVRSMLTETPMGWAWAVRVAALLIGMIIAMLSARIKASFGLSLAVVTGAVSLASLAWTGHGAAGEGRTGAVQLVADIVHLGAAGAWVGALAGLGLLLFRSSTGAVESDVRLAHRALAGFATTGTIIVGLIVATGLINSYVLVGPSHVLALPSSLYGRLLLVKLALFAMMLGLAAANRYRLTPILERAIGGGALDHAVRARAIRALRRSLVFEAGAATSILGLVAWLGTLPPPMSI